MAIKGLALIEERDRRKKKKEKELVQLKSPEKKETTTVKKTVNNKGTTYVDKSTISKKPTIQNTTQNRTVTNKDRLTNKSTFGGINTDIRTVKAQNKPKYSTETADVYERGGRYYYKDGKKEKEIDKKFVEDAIKNKKTGVIGNYDSKGKLKSADERGIVKSAKGIRKEKVDNLNKQLKAVGTNVKQGKISADQAITDIANIVDAATEFGKLKTYKNLGKTAANTATNLGTGTLKTLENVMDTANDLTTEITSRQNYLVNRAYGMSKKEAKQQMKEEKKANEKWVARDLTNEFKDITGYNKIKPQLEEGSLVTENNTLGQFAQGVGSMVPALLLGQYANLGLETKSLEGLTGLQKAKTVAGNMGRGFVNQAGANAILGTSSYGSGIEEAYREGATGKQAKLYGLGNAAIELGTEWLTGGIPGTKSEGLLDNFINGFIDKKTSKISNRYISNVLNSVLKSQTKGLGEGLEEGFADILNPLLKNLTYSSGEKIDWRQTGGDVLMGYALGMFLNSPESVNDLKKGINDAKIPLERKQQLKEELNAMVEQAKQQSAISGINPEDAISNMRSQLRTTDLAIQQRQMNEINQMKQSGLIETPEANQMIEQVKNGTYQQNRNLDQIAKEQQTAIEQARQTGQLSETEAVQEMEALNNTMADERKRINFLPTNTSDKVQNFKNSLINEKVNDADGFYKSVEKIIKDKDYNVILDSSITNQNGESVNAVISNEDGITIRINPNSERAGEILLTHEVTHGIETKEIKNLIMDYASKNPEFNEALEDLKRTYGTEDVTPEVIADISGQLLGNQEFIKTLSTEKPSLFKRIHDKIIELANKITGNSKEKRFIDDLKVKWERAYRESTIQSAQQNLKEGAKYSQNAEITDNKGRPLNINMQNYMEDSQATNDKGELVTLYHTTTDMIKQFNIFDPANKYDPSEYKFGKYNVTYLTDGEEMSESYSMYQPRKADTRRLNNLEEARKYLDNTSLHLVDIKNTNQAIKNHFKGNKNRYFLVSGDLTTFGEYKTEEELLRDVIPTAQQVMRGDSNFKYELYANIKKPYIIDAEGRNWNNIAREINEESKKIVESLSKEQKEELSKYANESLMRQQAWQMSKQYSEYLKYEGAYDKLDTTTRENLVILSMKDDVKAQDYREMYDMFKEGKDPDSKINVEGEEMDFADFAAKWCYYEMKNAKYAFDYSYFLYESAKKYKTQLQNVGVDKMYEMAKYNFKDWAIEDTLSKRLETNDIVKKVIEMNEKGEDYDGVIIKNTTDYGVRGGDEAHDLYVVFNSNQLKAVDNPNPTDDPDIRYSKKADKWQKFLEKYYPSRGTTTVLKDKVMKDFNDAKKGKLDDKKLRSYVTTSNEATGMEKTIKKADLDKLTYEVKSNKETYQQAKNNLKDLSYEERVSRSKQMLNSNKKITEVDITEAQIALLEAAQAGRVEDYLDLQQDIAIMGTELGRTIQAMSMIQKMSPDGQIATLLKIVKRKQATNNKAWKDVELNPDLVQKVLDTYEDETHTKYNQEEMEQAVDELKQDIADQLKVSAIEKINEWRYLSMLGNPKTHVRNLVGNVAMSVVKSVKDLQNAALQDIFIHDVEGKTATLKRASQEVKDLSDIAFEEMMKTDTKGNKYVEANSIEQKRRIFKSKVLEGLRKGNLKALNVEDNWFKKSHFKKSFRNYLTAKGITTLEDINNNPQIVADAKVFAMNEAKIATFQEENAVANWIKDLDKLGPGAEVIRGAVIPFTGVPMNIAKRGIEYTPGTGMLKTISDFKKAPDSQKGNVLIDGLSKQMTGSALAILGYALAKAGFATADAGDDKDDKYEKDIGAKMNYSIKINGKSYDLSWLSPSSMPFFVGVSGYEQWEKKEKLDANFIFEALASTLDPLSEMSVISSFTKVLSSYDTKGAKKIKSAGESSIQSYLSQFIPTVFSQFSRTLDDKKRNTYANRNSSWKFGEETGKQLLYKTPGRVFLPEQTDFFGNEKEESGWFEAFLSPASTKTDKSNKVSKELMKLYNETGDKGVIPSKSDNYIDYDNKKYEMTQREYNKFKKDYGTIAMVEISKALDDNEYKNLSKDKQAEVISNILQYSRYKAKDNYLSTQGVDYKNNKFKGAKNAEESGYAIADYYITKKTNQKETKTSTNETNRYLEMKQKGIDGKTFDKFKTYVSNARGESDKGGLSKNEKIKNYIQSLPLTAKQKQTLWNDYKENAKYFQYYN